MQIKEHKYYNPPGDGYCMYYCLIKIVQILGLAGCSVALPGIEISKVGNPDAEQARMLSDFLVPLRQKEDMDDARKKTEPLYWGRASDIETFVTHLLKQGVGAYVAHYKDDGESDIIHLGGVAKPNLRRVGGSINRARLDLDYMFTMRCWKDNHWHLDKPLRTFKG